MKDDPLDDSPSQVAKLRVRIKRSLPVGEHNSYEDAESILEELIALGHDAEALLPEIIERIGQWEAFASYGLQKLICNLKSSKLMEAVHNAEIKFNDFAQIELLESGFSEFEESLLDSLWRRARETSDDRFSEFWAFSDPICAAIGDNARLTETLDTLFALEEDMLNRFNKCKDRFEQEEDPEEKLTCGIILKSMEGHLKTLRGTIKNLQSRSLSGEALPDVDPAEIEHIDPPDEGEIMGMIHEGEGPTVEFKSSLEYSLREKKKDTRLHIPIIKTVAAFQNSNGGTLLIGVDDKGKILGLDKDYLNLKNGSGKDGFELHLRNILNSSIGATAVATRLDISFPSIDGKEICCVKVKESRREIFAMVKGKDGQRVEKFFIRSGNSSLELPPSQQQEYTKDKFGKD